ncbi:cell division protein FtsZ [Desulfobacula toluolica]|uniref:Cell division protein FtsZ n=1 Tax=Desulfobacula toluolica (strain DSM 7467 / Tol2) TaxID=651182 RepID=K0NHQ0_DESTT|nr:cell division protein FtsZ [Desulfobacula toluolica]CCK79368.1 FtsZ: cell division protein FtsZ [Desulfobacula toluolica Tol2]
MSFSYVESDNSAKIKVIGVGGAGGNAVNNMIDAKLQGVKFIVVNTDIQALDASRAEIKIQIGKELTEGLGAGADPNKGHDAALESMDELREVLEDSHMVFITAGFGGGTGTGAAPVIAEICKELGILTVAVASKPFSFEGKKRERQALEGLEKLHGITDTVITIPNDRLRGIAPKGAKMVDMFIKADEILHHSVKGITDLIMMPGHVNLDFADVKTTMQKAGKALMGIGIASGENRAVEAAERAISHPLLEDISISGAKCVLMNITSSSDLTLDEMTEASDRIYQEVGDDAEIIWGQTFDDSLGDEMRITVIATGIDSKDSKISNTIRQFDPPGQPGTYQQPGVAAQNVIQPVEPIVRGQLRHPTQQELANWDETNNPVIIKNKQAVDDENVHNYRTMPFDHDDLDVPTFLRRKAD